MVYFWFFLGCFIWVNKSADDWEYECILDGRRTFCHENSRVSYAKQIYEIFNHEKSFCWHVIFYRSFIIRTVKWTIYFASSTVSRCGYRSTRKWIHAYQMKWQNLILLTYQYFFIPYIWISKTFTLVRYYNEVYCVVRFIER